MNWATSRLILGLTVSLALLAYLCTLFLAERASAIEAIHSERHALESYARQGAQERLRQHLERAKAEIIRALDDPLLDDTNLLYYKENRQILPRLSQSSPQAGRPAFESFEALRAGRWQPEVEDGPQAWQGAALERLRVAIQKGDDAEIQRVTRALLSHQSRFVVAPEFQIPLNLAMLDLLHGGTNPSLQLMTIVLRDGFTGPSGQPLVGLQRGLLRHRHRFTEGDQAALGDCILALSKGMGIPWQDFSERLQTQAPPITLPANLETPQIIEGDYFVAATGSIIHGVRIEPGDFIAEIEAHMHRRALLEPEDRLRLDERPYPWAETLGILVESPRFAAEKQAATWRLFIKLALVLATAIFAGGIVLAFRREAQRKLEFAAMQSNFVAGISHELKTPLAGIRLMAETLERRLKGVEAARDYPTRLVREAERLSFLVENVLAYGRLNHGTWPLRPTPMTLGDIVAGLEKTAAYLGENIKITHESPVDAKIALAPTLSAVIFGNLMINACRHNRRGAATLALKLSTGATTRITVEDNGVGIAPSEWARVFEDFKRGSNTPAQGSGLGLALCRRALQAHGGSIGILHASEAGTTFEITLPGTQK